jgi:hypothetical protein
MYSQRVCIPGLQNLDLAHNRIGAEGLLDLVDGFKFGELEEDVEEKLSYLNLAGNELTECGQTTEALHALVGLHFLLGSGFGCGAPPFGV